MAVDAETGEAINASSADGSSVQVLGRRGSSMPSDEQTQVCEGAFLSCLIFWRHCPVLAEGQCIRWLLYLDLIYFQIHITPFDCMFSLLPLSFFFRGPDWNRVRLSQASDAKSSSTLPAGLASPGSSSSSGMHLWSHLVAGLVYCRLIAAAIFHGTYWSMLV
jgi:hypothetical protein